MLELSPYRKNKINLEDYDYKRDIKNRLLMSHFSEIEKEILEEILYSPPKISIKELSKQLNIEMDKLFDSLNTLSETGLLKIEGNETLLVNKEMRKYFENHFVKFEEDFFIPNMEFLQTLLRKVPIHILPTWYHIPRTSNNIFNSLIEKYLQTPQIFQRYLKELNLGDEILSGIAQDVFYSEELKVPSEQLRKKYNIDKEALEEYILHLEFNFVCCLGCEKIGDTWQEIVTPFHEWRQYLLFLRKTTPQNIKEVSQIQKLRPTEYAFADDMAYILNASIETPLPLSLNKEENCWEFSPKTSKELTKSLNIQNDFSLTYFKNIIQKACLLELAEIKNKKLIPHDDAKNWLSLSSENRALQIFKHPLNEMKVEEFPEELATDRNKREIEKSIHRIIDREWVLFENFQKGMCVSLSEENKVQLKKAGKHWEYMLPQYTEIEEKFIQTTVLEWLFEGGIISKGTYDEKPCIQVTSLGKALFE